MILPLLPLEVLNAAREMTVNENLFSSVLETSFSLCQMLSESTDTKSSVAVNDQEFPWNSYLGSSGEQFTVVLWLCSTAVFVICHPAIP